MIHRAGAVAEIQLGLQRTGCTLSSAIASYLALGDTLPKAIKHAKKYLTGALKAQLNLGHGSGPMDHFWKYR